MRNDEHFSMIVLGFAVFLFGCSHLSAIEFNVIGEDLYWLYWIATTAGMVMFVNSILTLYLRAQESVSQTISAVTQSSIEANTKGGREEK